MVPGKHEGWVENQNDHQIGKKGDHGKPGDHGFILWGRGGGQTAL